MLDDFFVRALVAGIGVAAVAGPLGCFVVWRRMSYFGDTLAHAALLGVALSLALDVNIMLGVFGLSLAISLALLVLQRRSNLSADAVLGLLSHAALAFGMLALAFMSWVRFDVMGLLFGDLLAVTRADIITIYAGGAAVIAALVIAWRPLFAITVNREMASAEGLSPARYDVLLMVLMACVVAVAIKIVGALLITAMLIIPAGAARRFCRGPAAMAVVAAAIGMVAVVAGLGASLTWDTPSGPSVIVAAVGLFLIGLLRPVPNALRGEVS